MQNTYYFLYQYILVPALSFLSFLLSLIVPKLKDGLSDRNWGMGRSYPSLADKDTYWFHCSSGELEYAKPVIRELKKVKDCNILVTWHSPSAKRIAKNIPEIDLLIPSPWESKSSYHQFLKHFKPKILLVSRTDLWPSMLVQTKNFGIPRILFSATFVKESARYKNPIAKSFYSWVHNLIDEIYCVTEDDKNNFIELNYKNKIKVTGDTRYEQVLWRLDNSPEPACSIPNSNLLSLLIGSSWAEDEKVLLPAYLKHADKIRLIVAPHEPNPKHIESLINFCEKNKLSYQLYTKSETFNSKVLIVDTIGVLASLYKYADISFIGGSFKGSIHSVMESLAAGCPSIFGPFHKNNREAIEFQNYKCSNSVPMAISCKDFNEIDKCLQELQSLLPSKITKSEITNKIKSKTGTTKLLLDSII